MQKEVALVVIMGVQVQLIAHCSNWKDAVN